MPPKPIIEERESQLEPQEENKDIKNEPQGKGLDLDDHDRSVFDQDKSVLDFDKQNQQDEEINVQPVAPELAEVEQQPVVVKKKEKERPPGW